MKLTEQQFKAVMHDVTKGATTKQLSNKHNISDRMVQRIKEAATWDRWPYVLAKSQFGYMTPEYKRYLKRRKLPLAAPTRPTLLNNKQRNKFNGNRYKAAAAKQSVVARLVSWIRSFF